MPRTKQTAPRHIVNKDKSNSNSTKDQTSSFPDELEFASENRCSDEDLNDAGILQDQVKLSKNTDESCQDSDDNMARTVDPDFPASTAAEAVSPKYSVSKAENSLSNLTAMSTTAIAGSSDSEKKSGRRFSLNHAQIFNKYFQAFQQDSFEAIPPVEKKEDHSSISSLEAKDYEKLDAAGVGNSFKHDSCFPFSSAASRLSPDKASTQPRTFSEFLSANVSGLPYSNALKNLSEFNEGKWHSWFNSLSPHHQPNTLNFPNHPHLVNDYIKQLYEYWSVVLQDFSKSTNSINHQPYQSVEKSPESTTTSRENFSPKSQFDIKNNIKTENISRANTTAPQKNHDVLVKPDKSFSERLNFKSKSEKTSHQFKYERSSPQFLGVESDKTLTEEKMELKKNKNVLLPSPSAKLTPFSSSDSKFINYLPYYPTGSFPSFQDFHFDYNGQYPSNFTFPTSHWTATDWSHYNQHKVPSFSNYFPYRPLLSPSLQTSFSKIDSLASDKFDNTETEKSNPSVNASDSHKNSASPCVKSSHLSKTLRRNLLKNSYFAETLKNYYDFPYSQSSPLWLKQQTRSKQPSTYASADTMLGFARTNSSLFAPSAMSPFTSNLHSSLSPSHNSESFNTSSVYRKKPDVPLPFPVERGLGGRRAKNKRSAFDSVHAAIVREAKEQSKGVDPENMYIQCPICQKRIKRLYHFQRHMRIHTGEKIHQCPYCQYKSVRKDNLKSHMKTHEKQNADGVKKTGKINLRVNRSSTVPSEISHSRSSDSMSSNYSASSQTSPSNAKLTSCPTSSPKNLKQLSQPVRFYKENSDKSKFKDESSKTGSNPKAQNKHEALNTNKIKGSEDRFNYEDLSDTAATDSWSTYDSAIEVERNFSAVKKRELSEVDCQTVDDIIDRKRLKTSEKIESKLQHGSLDVSCNTGNEEDQTVFNQIHPILFPPILNQGELEMTNNDDCSMTSSEETALNHTLQIRPFSSCRTAHDDFDFSTKEISRSPTNSKASTTSPLPSPGSASVEIETIDKATLQHAGNQQPSGVADKFFKNINLFSTSSASFSTSNAAKNTEKSSSEAVDVGRPSSSLSSSALMTNSPNNLKANQYNKKSRHEEQNEKQSPEKALKEKRFQSKSINSDFNEKFFKSNPTSPPQSSTPSKMLQCRLCQFRSLSNAELQAHVTATHKQGGFYKCKECAYLGKNLSKLVEHIRIHTGERPFKCDQCNYAAKRKDNLAQHKAVRHDKKKTKSGIHYSTALSNKSNSPLMTSAAGNNLSFEQDSKTSSKGSPSTAGSLVHPPMIDHRISPRLNFYGNFYGNGRAESPSMNGPLTPPLYPFPNIHAFPSTLFQFPYYSHFPSVINSSGLDLTLPDRASKTVRNPSSYSLKVRAAVIAP